MDRRGGSKIHPHSRFIALVGTRFGKTLQDIQIEIGAIPKSGRQVSSCLLVRDISFDRLLEEIGQAYLGMSEEPQRTVELAESRPAQRVPKKR